MPDSNPKNLIISMDVFLDAYTQVLENQLAIMERFSSGWTEQSSVHIDKRIGETRTLIRKLEE
jgi:hypothetical protein